MPLTRHFLLIPAWVHVEQPPLGLGRLRWGWTELSEQQWLDVRRRNWIGFAVALIAMAGVAWGMMISGCRC
jgi:hypothetical protein